MTAPTLEKSGLCVRCYSVKYHNGKSFPHELTDDTPLVCDNCRQNPVIFRKGFADSEY